VKGGPYSNVGIVRPATIKSQRRLTVFGMRYHQPMGRYANRAKLSVDPGRPRRIYVGATAFDGVRRADEARTYPKGAGDRRQTSAASTDQPLPRMAVFVHSGDGSFLRLG